MNRIERNFTKPELISKHLYCILCDDVFFNPFRISCGHSFCFECLENYKKKTKKCPECKKNITKNTKITKDLLAQKIIYDFQVRCANNKCLWKDKLEMLEAHLINCVNEENELKNDNYEENKVRNLEFKDNFEKNNSEFKEIFLEKNTNNSKEIEENNANNSKEIEENNANNSKEIEENNSNNSKEIEENNNEKEDFNFDINKIINDIFENENN